MSVKVQIPIVLRNLTKGVSDVDVDGKTVIDMINQLENKYPGIKERICEGDKIRRFVNVFVNEEDIRYLKGSDTPLKDSDQVSIIPAIAGGAFSWR